MGLNQNWNLLYFKGGHKESEKTIYRMGETISQSLYLIRFEYPEYVKNFYFAAQ